jgi:hypothetical protein
MKENDLSLSYKIINVENVFVMKENVFKRRLSFLSRKRLLLKEHFFHMEIIHGHYTFSFTIFPFHFF